MIQVIQNAGTVYTGLYQTQQDHTVLQVESGAFTHFECGDAACFPVRN